MSVVAIYNMALVPLGADRVLDPAEETEQARKCNEIYPYIRDDELSSHPWNFATAEVQLALTTTTPLYDYTYAYQKPSDCLRLLEIYEDDDAYRVIGDLVYTDVSSLYCRYIKLITDVNEYSSTFKSLLAARLKYELCFALTGSRTMTLELYEILTRIRKQAKAIDAQEGTPINIFGSRITDCRKGSVR